MLNQLIKIRSIKEFEEINTCKLDELLFEISTFDTKIKENLKKFPLITEYIFNLSQFDDYILVLFIFQRKEGCFPHQYQGPMKLINGKIDFSLNSYTVISSPYPWLQKIEINCLKKNIINNDETFNLSFDDNQIMTFETEQENTAFLQLVNTKTSSEKRLINNYLFEPKSLEHNSRKLIKLAKNFYLDKNKKDEASTLLKETLDKLDDHQLFLGQFVENYSNHIIEFRRDYNRYMNDRFGSLYFKEMYGDSNE